MLLTAAADEFEQKGYAGSTIRAILDKTGLTKGALYHHFDSKDGLAQALVSEQFKPELKQPTFDSPLLHVVEVTALAALAFETDVCFRAAFRLVADSTLTGLASRQVPSRDWELIFRGRMDESRRIGELSDRSSSQAVSLVVVAQFWGLAELARRSRPADGPVLRLGLRDFWRLLIPALLSDQMSEPWYARAVDSLFEPTED